MNINLPDQVSVNIFEKIDSICSEFRQGWKNKDGPRIEDYLELVANEAQLVLFRNLLQCEIQQRRRRNENPNSDEYIKRFPQFSRLIRQSFDESTMLSMDALYSTPDGKEDDRLTKTFELAANCLGGYQLIRELGRGGFGIVYEASHLKHQNRVALKTLPTGTDGQRTADEADRLHRFKLEFRSLSEVNHPNLIGMQTLEVDGGQWFFTMDLIDGVDFHSFVRPEGELDEKRLSQVMPQLIGGILALHDRQIVHRDLKPSNVLVEPDGKVVILDFGLVAELEQRTDQTASLKSQHFAGTPRYAAPEQMFGQRSEASDLYAVGVMLFEALTGDAPFHGSHLEILHKKQNEDPPLLTGRPGLPAKWAALADVLLQRAVERRPDADQLADLLRIKREISSPGSVDTNMTPTLSESEIELIGRDSQLAELQQAKQKLCQQKQPLVVMVSGYSGEGKSSLADKFLNPLRLDTEVLVLSGRCYDRESVPFKAVDSLIEALVAFMRSRNEREVSSALPQDVHLLSHLFPILRRVEAVADRSKMPVQGVDNKQIRYRAFAALRQLLQNIGNSLPIVIFIDDLQWGDGDSAEILWNLLSPPNPPPIMFLGSYRSDEAENSHFLQEWNRLKQHEMQSVDHRDIHVSPLTEQQCVEFLTARIDGDPESLKSRAHALFENSKGNPYFLEQLVQAVDEQIGSTGPIPLKEVIGRQLLRLPADATALLDAIAVSGKALSVDEASKVAGHGAAAFATLTHMRSEHLVRLIGSQEQQMVDTYHDKIRETVLDQLDDTTRREIHLKFGEVIESDVGIKRQESDPAGSPVSDQAEANVLNPRIFDLAYHFSEAGDRRAFDYQLQAGQAALGTYALEKAIEHLQTAERIMPDDADSASRYRLTERLANAFSRTQRLEEALAQYQNAEPHASDTIERAVALDGIGEVYQRMGQPRSAISMLDKALETLGYRRARWLPRVIVQTVWYLNLCTFMWVVPRHRRIEDRKKAQLASEIFHRFAEIYIMTGELFRYVNVCLQIVFSSLRSGDSRNIAVGFAKLGFNNAVFSFGLIAKWMFARAKRFADRNPDEETVADVDSLKGFSLYALGDLKNSKRLLHETVEFMSRFGQTWTRIMTYHHLRHIYAIEGDYENELKFADLEVEIGIAAADPDVIGMGHYGIANAMARFGQLEDAHQHMRKSFEQLAISEGVMSDAVANNHAGFLLIQSSNYSEAVVALEKSRRVFEKQLIYSDYTIQTYPLMIEALVGPKWRKPRKDPEIRKAKRLSRRSLFFGWRFPNVYSHTLRVQGRLECVLGRTRRARKFFEKSIVKSKQQGTNYQLARALLDLAAVDQDRCPALRNEAIEILKRIKGVIPYAERWQLGDDPDQQCVAPLFENEVVQAESD